MSLAPKTTILTPLGASSVDLIRANDEVMDGNGNPQRVMGVFASEASGLLEVSAVGILPIRGTPDQQILSGQKRRRRYQKQPTGRYKVVEEVFPVAQWVPFGSLKAGDWIAVPIPQPIHSDTALTIERKGQTQREVSLTPEFAKLCGYYCGDGWYEQHEAVQAVGFALDDKFPEIQADLKALITRVLCTHIYSRKRKNHARIGFHDPALGQFFSATIGNRSENKRIPDYILYHRDLSLLTAFLQGYLNTDGAQLQSSGKLRGVQWGGISRTLNLQLQAALTRYGTLAAIKYHCCEGQVMINPRTGKACKVQDAYVIQTSDRRVLDALGEPYDAKRHVCWSYQNDGKIWTRVKAVKPVTYSGTVYDLDVTSPHSYTANNIVVRMGEP